MRLINTAQTIVTSASASGDSGHDVNASLAWIPAGREWFTAGALEVTAEYLFNVVDPSNRSDANYSYPTSYNYGSFRFGRAGFFGEKHRLELQNQRITIASGQQLVLGSRIDEPLLLNTTSRTGTGHALSVGAFTLCGKVEGLTAVPPLVSTFKGGFGTGDGGLCFKFLPGGMELIESRASVPWPRAPLTLTDFLLPETIAINLRPGLNVVVTTNYYANFIASNFVLRQPPVLLQGNAPIVGNSFACGDGNSLPLPGNFLCGIAQTNYSIGPDGRPKLGCGVQN